VNDRAIDVLFRDPALAMTAAVARPLLAPGARRSHAVALEQLGAPLVLTFAHRGVRWDSPQTALHPAHISFVIARAAMADLAFPA
jgi:hypothetical protein